eukprot:CCRYP_020320-RA/>CCRYP_020320-RA protein AED:0.22 eAED:0.22 QI:0/0/0/1/0.5/0.33/3/0/386
MDELTVGELLGKGSFSNVHEITKIALKGTNSDELDDVGNSHSPRSLLAATYLRNPPNDKSPDASPTCRYAVKFLKEDIRKNHKRYAVGTTDLVVEGLFLASLSHPHIIKVRGLPEGGVNAMIDSGSGAGDTRGYFLILDRLFDTLSDRIYNHWAVQHRMMLRASANGRVRELVEERNENLAIRVKVAFDIAAALKYLHEKRIIYRDLKPENLGFDVRGDIKLFDLGLVKELHPDAQDRNGNYKLSMAGTPRYMSPECGMYRHYNLSADVYSFSMLLWEIIALEKPLQGFSFSQLKKEVFQEGFRPPLKTIWHKGLRTLIAAGWSQNPNKRPQMDEVYEKLKQIYTALKPGRVSEEEVSHSRRRSTYVPDMWSRISIRHIMSVEGKE